MFYITPFFELSLVLLTTHAIGLYEVTKNNTIKAGGSTARAQSKMSEWSGWMDTPYTIMTTRAPTVLIRVSQAVSKMFGKKMH